MKVAVGSTNPVKIAAVRDTVTRVWPACEIIAADVPSGISEMPLDDRETIAGARNRARAACAAHDADLGIGLEGGVHPDPEGMMLTGWVVVVDGNGREGVGGAARMPLPAHITARIAQGEELGPIMDELLDDHNTRQKGGAVGALTNGLVLRGDTFAVAVAYALAPFVAPHLFSP